MQSEITYNWDDIEVGRFDLNHSENFFTQKHLKHEKFSEEFQLVNDQIVIRAMEGANPNEFRNEIAKKSSDKENTNPSPNRQHKQTIDPPLPVKVEDPVSSNGEKNKSQDKSPLLPTSSNVNRRPANLLTRPKTPQIGNKIVPVAKKNSTKADPPHVYEFVDIYQKKKEEKMKKLLEEEKKNRIFHSRPAPRSVIKPRDSAANKQSQCRIIMPAETPLVLKHSREADERRRERLEEWKRNNPAPKFSSREALVLQEEPFKPKKSARTITPQPFNLNVEKRIEERKHFDEQYKRNVEMKAKEEEEQRKKREEQLNKEIRKLATFKARPNPFK